MLEAKVNFAEADKVVEEWFEKWTNDSLCFADIDKVWTSWISKIKDPGMASSRHEDFITILDKFLFYGYSSDRIEQIVKNEEFTTCNRASSYDYQPFYFKCTVCEASGVSRRLCAECYENSEHRTHNYTMSRGNRLEYCCCGEDGTWEKTWYCTKHSDKEKLNVLPEDVESRARIVIETIVAYAEDLLNCYKNIDQNEDGNDDECHLALYTNSIFKLDDFRRLMFSMLPVITNEDFFTYSQKLTQDGRIYIKLPKRNCKNISAILKEINCKYTTMVLSDDSVIRLEFIVGLLSYLQKVLTYGDKFRDIFSKSILTPFSHSNQCLAENFLLFSWTLPKTICNTFIELIIFGTMKKYETKERLAKMIMAKYDVIIHKIDTKPVNAVNLINGINNQLFSIPDLAHYFITQEDALSVAFTRFLKDTQKAYEEFEKNSKNSEEYFECDMKTFNPTRYHMNFVETLLGIFPEIWSEELRMSFLNGLTCFLRVLSTFQGIAPLTRNTGKRVEYEKDDWPQNFISNCLFRCMQLMLWWCVRDDEALGVAYEKTFNMINERIGFETERSKKTVSVLSYSIQCLPYDSAIHPVSIYLPLYRFFVRLLMQLRKHDSLETTTLPAIFDSVLKINAMLAQVLAGMWKLNEDFLENLPEDYCIENRTINFESDILLSQIVASTTEPNKFLIEVLEKYGLIDWASDRFTTREDDEMEQVIRISEQFLKFLNIVLIERYVPDVSYVTNEDYLQQDVIHCLCIKPSSRLEIKKFINLHADWDTDTNKVIEEVAVSKSVCAGEAPIFELRKEFFDRFNALYYHYDQQNISNANEFQRQRRKAAGEPDCFPPHQLPKLKEFFQPIVGIFHCDIMLHIMRTVLVRFLDFEAKCSSETQIQNVLYLIGHALQEEKSGYYPNLCFTKKAVEWKLLDYLEMLLRSNRDDLPKALLQWTIRKFNEVINPTAEVSLAASASDEREKLKRSQMIAAKRDQVMKNMIEMQNQFVEKNPVVHDREQTINQPKLEKICILCQGTERIDFENENVLVMPGFVQYSTVLCDDRSNISADDESLLLSSNVGPAFYTSSCGHVMHEKCLNDSSSELDTSDEEFFCPLCETFSNALLPVLPPSSSFKKHQSHISSQLKEASLEFMDQFQKLPNSNSLQVWKSLSYTVHVVETILRDSNKPILGHLSSHHQRCLESFINIAEAANLFYSNDALYKSKITELRSLLTLKNPKKKKTIQSDSLLRFDIFSLFVAVVFSGIAKIRGDNYNIFCLVFVAQIIQILITTNFDEMVDDDVKIEDETCFKSILRLSGKNLDHLSEKFVWNYIQKSCIPFLRCCVLFYSFLNDGPSPIELTELNGDTFSNMCSYLGFPQTREELFHNKKVVCHIQNWLKHPNVKGQEFSKRNPNHINQLTELPHTYLELIRKTAVFKCVRSFNKQPNEVHICLVCGEMLCTGLCCEEYVEGEVRSSFYKHSHKTHTNLKTCGSDLYLDVDKNTIMFRSSSEEVGMGYLAGPYDYGDTDVLRSSPTFLSLEKYKELHTLMLNHNIFEKTVRDLRNEIINRLN